MTFLIPTMKRVRDIRKEYGESFSAVVGGYAKLGYSKKATREVLEIHGQLFQKLLTSYDLHRHFNRKNYNDSCVPKGKGWPKGKMRRAA